jgi:small ligand-binding sensory domain FIST
VDAAKAARGAPFMAAIGVVHGDPRHEDVTSLIAALGQGSGAYLVGGLTSADRVFPQVAGSTTLDGGVSGVLLGGRNVQVAVGLTQGCSPIGPSHTITSLQGQVLVTLDDEPAFEVLRRDVGAGSDADPRRWLADIHAAIPVSGSDRADYVVRNIVGIGPDEGLVAIADNLDLGDRVMFVRRDAEAADRDLQRMLGELKARTRTPPKAGLYYSCLARGPNLFAEAAHEMRAIEQAFDDIPIVGFFGNGEIAHDRLYGYTGVLALFS